MAHAERRGMDDTACSRNERLWNGRLCQKRTFTRKRHFVTDRELAKSYAVLPWAYENALFDTLAGIEQIPNILIYRIYFLP